MTTATGKIVPVLPAQTNSEHVIGQWFRGFSARSLDQSPRDILDVIAKIDHMIVEADGLNLYVGHDLVDGLRVRIHDPRPEIAKDPWDRGLVLTDDLADTGRLTRNTNPLLGNTSARRASFDCENNPVEFNHLVVSTGQQFIAGRDRTDMPATRLGVNSSLRGHGIGASCSEASNLTACSRVGWASTNLHTAKQTAMRERDNTESNAIHDANTWLYKLTGDRT